MLYLKRCEIDDLDKIWPFLRDMPYDENGFINEWSGCSREECKKAIETYRANERGEMLPEGYVPETFLLLWKDDEIVGEFRIRHYLCESLIEGAGHIGYSIRKEFRGNGYASEGLRLALERAKEIIPEDEIYLRVNKLNPASLRVMLKNGGYVHHEDEKSYFVRIKNNAR